jgi:hypothetical protein
VRRHPLGPILWISFGRNLRTYKHLQIMVLWIF